MNNSTHKLALSITASILAACGAQGYELNLGTNLPPVDFHGFLSQGYLDSSKYNYLGDSTRGSFLFTEAGLNASINPLPRTRITAQAFTFDVGQDVGKYDVILDYALAEYTFSDKFGIRAGRIRRPEGIYNHIQDVDLARTFVLLPQGVYDSRWRDFYVSVDGGEIFGDFSLDKAGDLSYEAYAGMINPAQDGGVAKVLRNVFVPYGGAVKLASIDSNPQTGLQLWWNTPLNGFRVGAMGGYNIGFNYNTVAQTPGGPVYSANRSDIPFAQGSLEYLWKSWTFQSEYFTYMLVPDTGASTRTDAWYASAAYRFNKWFEAGAYYTEYYNDVDHRDNSALYQKDAALALRFDPTDWWVFKIEGHYIHGTGLLDDNVSNPVQNGNGWFMLAVKTTFSF